MFQPRFEAVLEYCGLKTKGPWGAGSSVVNSPSRLLDNYFLNLRPNVTHHQRLFSLFIFAVVAYV